MSVVIIFLNEERFLAEAIESVIAQTYDQWELILVDDGSTDRSAEIAQEYVWAHRDRIKFARHPGGENRGMSASRNLGISLARGELISLLDGDDVYLPEKLEHQVGLLDAHPDVGMIYGTSEYWYSWTGLPNDVSQDRVRTVGVLKGRIHQPPRVLLRILQNRARTPCTCGVLLRREVVDRAGGFEESFRGMFEDQIFFYKVLRHTPVYVSPECHDRYRQHPDSHVGTHQDKTSAAERFSAWRRDYLSGPANAHPKLTRALQLSENHPVYIRLLNGARKAAGRLLAPN